MTITAENLQARAQGIGSSDAPTVMGTNPYAQPVDLWLEKTGQAPGADLSRNMAVRMGNVLEDPIAREWAAITEKQIRKDLKTFVLGSWPVALSHIDRRVLNEKAVLEVKCRGPRQADQYGPSGGDGGDVMASDYVQCQHHALCGGWDRVYMAVYLGGGDLRTYTVERDDEYLDKLLETEKVFWAYVQGRERPPMDFHHRTTPALLKSMYPGTDGTTVELGNHGQALHEALKDARARASDADKEVKALKAELADLMGEASIGMLPDGTGYRRKEVAGGHVEYDRRAYIDMRYVKRP